MLLGAGFAFTVNEKLDEVPLACVTLSQFPPLDATLVVNATPGVLFRVTVADCTVVLLNTEVKPTEGGLV